MTADVPSALEILRRFRHEKADPEPFYVGLADRTLSSFPRPVAGKRILDLGCGPGWYSVALRRGGARVISLDLGADDVHAAGGKGLAALIGDGQQMPFPDGAFDGIFCSNLLEHVPDPEQVLDEVARLLAPGGWAWISWTPWFSPWGGHEIVPLHLLGPKLGPRVWTKFFGRPKKNVPYEELWPTYVGSMMKAADAHAALDVDAVYPRYYPFMRWIMSVPGLREVASWNCVIEVTRSPAATH